MKVWDRGTGDVISCYSAAFSSTLQASEIPANQDTGGEKVRGGFPSQELWRQPLSCGVNLSWLSSPDVGDPAPWAYIWEEGH